MPLERLGPYRLEKLLGRGGMGAVYVGRHAETGQRAAVKVLSGHLADDAAFRERFKQEIETLKRLLHPNIVQLFGYGEDDGHLFYVMELVEGHSLQDELSAGRRFTWREAARIGIAVAQALKHAHDRGIIHRDLKPANLLIDSQEHLKLADFGIAKLYGGTSVTVEGGVLGTADYMAPEQAEGSQVTSRCDLYALGSVLYALLTGRPPFTGRTALEVLSALQSQRPIPVRRLAPDTPEEFERIVMQLLEKDSQKRIPTAMAVANRLKAMEHALSLETQVDRTPPDAAPPPDVPTATPRSPHTEWAEPSSRPTREHPLAADADEYQLAHEAPTIVSPPMSQPSSPTSRGTGGVEQRSAAATGNSQATNRDAAERASRFTTVDPAHWRRRDEDETSSTPWLLMAGLAAVAVLAAGSAIFFFTRPPSADSLYAAVERAAQEGGAEALLPVESEMSRFLERYPDDPRTEQVRAYEESLARYRLERRLEARVRRADGDEGLLPVERAYLEAMRRAATDPHEARADLEAIQDLYAGPPDESLPPAQARATRSCLELVRQQIERLKVAEEEAQAADRQAVEARLKQADRLAATDRRAAERIWQGVIRLYGKKPWAADLVAQARTALKQGGPAPEK